MSGKLRALFCHRLAFPPSGLRVAGLVFVCVLLASLMAGCASGPKRSGKSYVINGKRYYILATAEGYKEKGLASWYGEPFHGRKTASGEVYDMNEVTAAHKTLPLHSWVEVVNTETRQKLLLRINDRGPFVDGRIIDLSKAAAKMIGVYRPGTAKVVVVAVPVSHQKQLNDKRLRAKKMRGKVASN
ncbi:MAG: septal ring lytic transglycosylase RlpA family protein [Deltaproteobacteria bacterium]|jgi:rare lipoprotein A|nr:septal ring lytic transglycosylase RlpA family protein [Deltaproteobacteria bacterium]